MGPIWGTFPEAFGSVPENVPGNFQDFSRTLLEVPEGRSQKKGYIGTTRTTPGVLVVLVVLVVVLVVLVVVLVVLVVVLVVLVVVLVVLVGFWCWFWWSGTTV